MIHLRLASRRPRGEPGRPWSRGEIPCQRRAHFTVKLSDMWSHLTPGFYVKEGKVRAKHFGGPDFGDRVRSLARRRPRRGRALKMLAEARARRRAAHWAVQPTDAGCHMEAEGMISEKRAGGGLDSAASSVMERIFDQPYHEQSPKRTGSIVAYPRSPLAPAPTSVGGLIRSVTKGKLPFFCCKETDTGSVQAKSTALPRPPLSLNGSRRLVLCAGPL